MDAVMLRTHALLGKWKGWDHIRGIKKVGGSIHIRHTHGSKGRYDRLSTKFGLRDGRRHISNHMKGGLGIKLGGGLFGLRIARQHALSSMTPDELDVELHGHPNITNPYRNMIEQHPDLEGVVRNPSLRATFVVAMPQVRRASWSSAVPLPILWREAQSQLVEIAQSFKNGTRGHPNRQQITLILCTSDSSVSLQFDRIVEDDNSRATINTVIAEALDLLFRDFCRGVRIDASSNASAEWITIEGKRMLVNSKPGNISKQIVATSNTAKRNSINVDGVGLAGKLKQLSETEPNALRMQSTLLISPKSSSGAQILPTGSSEAENADELIRWFLYNNDPRAHFKDAAPHSGRLFSVHTLVDCAALRCSSGVAVTRSTEISSAVGHKVSALLRGAGYRFLKENPLQLAECLSKWTMDARVGASSADCSQLV
jgi:hypothetical protein